MSKLHALVVASHGAFFGWNYYKLFIEVLNQNWDLFETVGKKPDLWEMVPETRRHYVQLLITNLDNIKLDNGRDLFQMVKHPRFKHELESRYDYLHQSTDHLPFEMVDALAQIFNLFIPFMNYISPRLYTAVCLQANKNWLLDLVKQYNDDDIELMCMTGALEQSYALEQTAKDIYGTKEFAHSLKAIEFCLQFFLKSKNIKIDPFMMADIYGNLPEGSTHAEILSATTNNGNRAETVYDDSNASLLYAIAHHLTRERCEKNPTEEKPEVIIDFNEHSQTVIQKLGMFYILNSELLPDNVTLNIYAYNGEEKAEHVMTIKGTGRLDRDYAENIKLMAKSCGHDLQNFNNHIDVAKDLNVKEFLQQRKMPPIVREQKQEKPDVKSAIPLPLPKAPKPTVKPITKATQKNFDKKVSNLRDTSLLKKDKNVSFFGRSNVAKVASKASTSTRRLSILPIKPG